ncbi:MAG: M15 family metallopeptidase [Cyanobacteria bacterium J06598_3]
MKTTDITSSSKLVASVSNSPNNDIPPARRQPTEISLAEIESIGVRRPKPKRRGGKRFLAFLFLAGIAGVGIWQWKTVGPYVMPSVNAAKNTAIQGKDVVAQAVVDFKRSRTELEDASSGSTAVAEASPGRITITKPGELTPEQGAENPSAGSSPSVNPIATGKPDELLNHRRYDVAEEAGLVTLNPNSDIRLKPSAQEALTAMLAKAKADGIRLGVVSGFRTLADQDYLYFELKAERGQSAQTRAEVSAPPGYSEHHTGYAVDLIDESKPNTHVEESFSTTPAFEWLQKNAAFYNFEMSFPKNPSSPVGYEPWHWRYVGNQESLELFYKE